MSSDSFYEGIYHVLGSLNNAIAWTWGRQAGDVHIRCMLNRPALLLTCTQHLTECSAVSRNTRITEKSRGQPLVISSDTKDQIIQKFLPLLSMRCKSWDSI